MDDKQLLQEINERLIRIENYQQQERRRRIIRLCIIAAIILILAIISVPKVVTMVHQYNQVMSQVDSVIAEVDGIKAQFDGIVSDFEDVKGKIDSFDFDALKNVIAEIQSAIDSLNNFRSFF